VRIQVGSEPGRSELSAGVNCSGVDSDWPVGVGFPSRVSSDCRRFDSIPADSIKYLTLKRVGVAVGETLFCCCCCCCYLESKQQQQQDGMMLTTPEWGQ